MAIEITDLDTFPKLLLHNSKQRADLPAIRQKRRGIWRTVTWRDLADEVAALAGALSARGLKRGAHVAMIGDNRPRLFAAMCAAQCLGAVAMPLYQDATADELVAPIKNAEATHIFAENQEQVDKLLEILPQCSSIQCIIYDDDRGMRHYNQPQLVNYATLLEEGRKSALQNRDFLQGEIEHGTGEDAAFLFFTSGTTGPAKGVVLTHVSLINRARVVATAEGLNDSDMAMAYLPPGWICQNLFSYVQPMVVGYCVCCPESSDTMLADMREVAPTCFLATPRMLDTIVSQVSIRIADAGGFNLALYRSGMKLARHISARALAGKKAFILLRLASKVYNFLLYGPLRDALGMSKLRVAYTAGDAIDPDQLMFFRALGINLKQLYGSTETGFFVAMHSDGEVKPDTVGPVVEGVELKFTPQREILVRSPGLFKEYHRDPETTTRVKNSEGWFHTGDTGYLDDDGHLRIIDRTIYVGTLTDGTSFAPRQIENKLNYLSYIKESVAFGDGRDKVCALIDIDTTAVGRWADKQELSYTGHADLASLEEVYSLIAVGIAKINADMSLEPTLARSQIRRFLILPKELNADDGLLTRTGKLRRDVIAERYKPLVEALYGGRTEVSFKTGVDPDDVQGDAVSADLKIRDAKIVASEQGRRAA